jgi:hypothetical protein
MELLLADPDFVDYVAAASVDRLVDAGVLIRTAQLRSMPLEFVPSGTTEYLRDLLRRVHAAPGKKLGAALLLEIAAAVEGHDQPAAVKSEPAGDQPDEDPPPGEGECEEARRPSAMPTGPGTCTVCGDDIDERQHQLSWTRFRLALCKTDQAAHKTRAA